MKIFKVLISVQLFVIIALGSCEKSNNDVVVGDKLEFYLLEDYTTVGNSMQIDESTAIISDQVVIGYDEIISYNSSTYSFKVAQEIIDKFIQNDGLNYHTRAFAVTVDKEIIYTGYFWYAYSSRSCDWVTIDPIISSTENGLKVNLAYPTDQFRTSDLDKRNDSRILRLLKTDGKLVQ
jgi:hypothetical protein